MFEKDKKINFNESPHSPHSIIFNLIERDKVVLDVGCNYGLLGKKLLEKQVITDGVDINKNALSKAKMFYRSTFLRDLYKPSLKIKNKKYDYIIFSDILEHLPRPDLLLKDSKKYLNKNGKIIVSIPNIARLEIRIKLFFGIFNYSPGILSQDHLRFFTKKSAIDMLINCGYKVTMTIPTGLGHMVKIFPGLTAFQNVFVCEKV